MTHRHAVAVVSGVLACFSPAWGVARSGAAAEPPTLRIVRATRPPAIERIAAGAVPEGAVVRGFRQWEPADGAPASQDTTAYVSYDADHVYVVFVCHDRAGQVRASLTRRDDIESDDQVFVYLDTFHDRRNAYLFAVNPLGIQADGTWTEGQGWDLKFDTLWHSAGRELGEGYVASMAIPFKSLRFPRARIQTWGIALGRVVRRNAETVFWPHLTRRIASAGEQFAALEGLENISMGRTFRLIPYGTATLARLPPEEAAGTTTYRNDGNGRVGLDAKIGFRDALTLDTTVNPDFSQVESDEPQVTINKRYEVFFPEKRPFFLENASYFETPTSVFFSRRIVDPQCGARLTGKTGPWGLGALVMDDRHAAASGTSEGRQRAVIGVGRVQRELRNQSTIGFLATARAVGREWNQVVSVDARLRFGPNWSLSGQATQSVSRDVTGRGQSGQGYAAEVARKGHHLQLAMRYTDLSPRFRADLGFVPRVDVRQAEQVAQYYWRPERGRVVAIGPDVTVQFNWSREGKLQDRRVDVSFGADLRGPSGLGCRHVDAFELYLGVGFRHRQTDCGFSTSWLRWLELSSDFGRGSGINYAPAQGVLPFVGASATAKFGLVVRPTPGIRVGQSYLYTSLASSRLSLPAAPAGMRVFEDHILRTRITWQVTREWSVRGIVDYRAVRPNAALVAVERSRRLTVDALLTFLVNPGTALYVGYTDNRESSEDIGAWPSSRRLGMVSTGRQVFVKFGCLIPF